MRKVSQHYEMAGGPEQLEIAKNSDVIFYREPDTAAGRLHDGNDRLRQPVEEGQRAVRDRRSA